MKKLFALVLAAAVSGCGGDGESQAVAALESAATTPVRMQALAETTATDASQDAERLMAHAEQNYKDLFPTAETTRNLNGWSYRHYPQSGVFLAVINARVFVVGGPFGADARDVGAVSDYITVTPPSNQAPTVSLTLALTPSSQAPTIQLTATVADSDGTVGKVEFFNGSTKLGETTAEPHVFTLRSAATGLYELTAKATDNDARSTSTPVTLLEIKADGTPAPQATITVAKLANCATAYGSSAATTYNCLAGSTPQGAQTLDPSKTCSMTVSNAGVITVSTAGQNYSVSVPELSPTARNFTKTSAGLSFDYGSTSTSASSIRIKGRTEDKVLGQFFQQGGNLVVEVKRTSPELDLSCTIPLALS